MPERRRKFSPQFKAEAVQLVLETGKPIAEVTRDTSSSGSVENVNVSRRHGCSPHRFQILTPTRARRSARRQAAATTNG
jgi:transposase-like protein